LTYDYGARVFQVVVNGYNENIAGEQPPARPGSSAPRGLHFPAEPRQIG